MLVLKVLLLTIIMTQELTLRTKFDLDAIIFCTIKHPIPYSDYMSSLFDAHFRNKSMLKENLVYEGIIVDKSDYSKYYEDVVDCIRNFITAHVKLVVTSDGDDCQLKMDKVVLKTIHKTCFSVLETARQFNTANTAYHSSEKKRHEDINDMECFIVYLDITQLYPSCTEYINALDWTKIHLTIQPNPTLIATATVTTTNNNGTTTTDIDRLVAAMDQ